MAKKNKAEAATPEVDTKGKKGKAEKAEKVEKTEKAEKSPEFKFGVAELAEKLDLKEASVRVQLRNKGIEKAGKSYGWNTKAELEEVAKQLKSKDDAGEAKAEKTSKKDKKAKDEPAAEPDAKADKKAKKDKKKK